MATKTEESTPINMSDEGHCLGTICKKLQKANASCAIEFNRGIDQGAVLIQPLTAVVLH
jgi:hypothetical protein